MRGFLTEQGSKRLSKADLWALVMASTRLRLTAHSMASLPTRTAPHADDAGLHAALGGQLADPSAFYDQLASEVDKPVRGGPRQSRRAAAQRVAIATMPPCGEPAAYRSDALWVGTTWTISRRTPRTGGPGRRLAELRRRPWWR